MAEQHNRRVAELFEAALREEPAHRSEFLRRACADDESPLIEVRSLVDEDERLGNATGTSLKETASMTSFASFDVSGIRNIARYLVVRELGRGGMGVVLEARDPLIGRTVAIKTIRLDALAGSSDARSLQDSLLREARAAGALSHPGIVIVHDFGVYDNLTYIAMEYVDGPTLQRKLTIDGRIERKEAVDLLRQIAVALDYAHAAGVVHRDVKPGNIMLQRGTVVKITDFGIAKVSTTHQLIHTGTVVGTPAYMAPEQIRALPVGGRSDQFSLAVVAFEMLTGVRPFRAKSMPELVHQVVYGERPSARAANPALSPVADAVFHRGLANLPEDRYESCLELVRELEAALDEKVPPSDVRHPGTHEQKVVSVDAEVKDGVRMRAAELGVEFEGAVAKQADVEPEARHSPLQTRMLDVGMQAQVPIHEPAELVALIRRTESAGLKAMVEIDPDFSINEQDVRSKPLQIAFSHDKAGRIQPLELTLNVASPDFEPKEQSKVVLVPPDRDSEAYTFLLTPQHLGELRLTLDVRVGALHIASKIIKTHAERSERITGTAGRSLVSIPIQVLVDIEGAVPGGSFWGGLDDGLELQRIEADESARKRLSQTMVPDPRRSAPSALGAFTRLFQHKLDRVRRFAGKASQGPAGVSSAPGPEKTTRILKMPPTAGDQPAQPCPSPVATAVPKVPATPSYRRPAVVVYVAIVLMMLGFGYSRFSSWRSQQSARMARSLLEASQDFVPMVKDKIAELQQRMLRPSPPADGPLVVTTARFTIDVLVRGTQRIENGSSFSLLDPQLGELAPGDLRALVSFEGQHLPRGSLKLEWTLDGVVMDSKVVVLRPEKGAEQTAVVEYGNEPTPGTYRIKLILNGRQVQMFTFRISHPRC
jgi:serine/threonine protein kinase